MLSKAIFIGFELLLFVTLIMAAISALLYAPWPVNIALGTVSGGGAVLIGMVVIDMVQS